MKKHISIIALLFVLLASLCSCSESNIKSITVMGETLYSARECEAIYLYKFKEADISYRNFTNATEDNKPTSTGYIYSTEELEIGDDILVWNQFKYSTGTGYNSTTASGVNASVAEVVQVYGVTLSSGSSYYKIGFYSVNETLSNTAVEKKEDLAPVHKCEVRVPKDKSTLNIEYN